MAVSNNFIFGIFFRKAAERIREAVECNAMMNTVWDMIAWLRSR